MRLSMRGVPTIRTRLPGRRTTGRWVSVSGPPSSWEFARNPGFEVADKDDAAVLVHEPGSDSPRGKPIHGVAVKQPGGCGKGVRNQAGVRKHGYERPAARPGMAGARVDDVMAWLVPVPPAPSRAPTGGDRSPQQAHLTIALDAGPVQPLADSHGPPAGWGCSGHRHVSAGADANAGVRVVRQQGPSQPFHGDVNRPTFSAAA